MLKLSILASCLVITAASWCLASNYPSGPQYHLIYLSDLTEKAAEELLLNPQETDILVCTEGTRLPIRFALQGDLIELVTPGESSYQLVIKRPFYLRLANDELLISLDGTQWKKWNELLTGMLNVTVSSPDNAPQIQLCAEAHIR